MTETIQNLFSGVIGAAGATIYFVLAHWPKIKSGFEAAKKVLTHLENNQAAKETAVAAAQIAMLPADTDPAVRDALLKSLAQDALAALEIEASAVGETYREAIIKYVTAKTPDPIKELVPGAIDALLQAIQTGRDDAKAHAAIQAALTLKNPA